MGLVCRARTCVAKPPSEPTTLGLVYRMTPELTDGPLFGHLAAFDLGLPLGTIGRGTLRYNLELGYQNFNGEEVHVYHMAALGMSYRYPLVETAEVALGIEPRAAIATLDVGTLSVGTDDFLFLFNAIELGVGAVVEFDPAYLLFQPVGLEVRPLTFVDDEGTGDTSVNWAMRVGIGLSL